MLVDADPDDVMDLAGKAPFRRRLKVSCLIVWKLGVGVLCLGLASILVAIAKGLRKLASKF